MPAIGSRLSCYCLLALLIVSQVRCALAQEDAQVAPSRFSRTVTALAGADAEVVRQFASEALGELFSAYSAEADLARRQLAAGVQVKKLRGWSAAVDHYARRLLLALDDLEQGLPVALAVRQGGVVVVTVAGRPVMLTHPRVGQQLPYEARVLEAFCSVAQCAALMRVDSGAGYDPGYMGQLQPEWRFDQQGATCYHDGVSLAFSPVNGLPGLRRLCRRFFEELSDLRQELAWQQVLDARIDWDALAIRPSPGKTQHFIVLNQSGDTALSVLPLLYANAGLLSQLTPWLQERLSGNADAVLSLNGSALRDVPN